MEGGYWRILSRSAGDQMNNFGGYVLGLWVSVRSGHSVSSFELVDILGW
jgi:hypothetical protein